MTQMTQNPGSMGTPTFANVGTRASSYIKPEPTTKGRDVRPRGRTGGKPAYLPLAVNLPGPAFANRLSFPLTLISREIAA
jgi:hypothetical protein